MHPRLQGGILLGLGATLLIGGGFLSILLATGHAEGSPAPYFVTAYGVVISLIGLLAGVLLLVSLLLVNDYPRLFCGMLFFVKFFSDWSLTTTWGAVTDIGGRTSATVFAFNNSVATSGAISTAQLLRKQPRRSPPPAMRSIRFSKTAAMPALTLSAASLPRSSTCLS